MDAGAYWRAVAAGLALMTLAGAAVAQTPAQDTAAGPELELSAAQRDTIYQSISRTQKNNPAPDGFRVAVGGHLPDAIALSPMPDTILQLMPQTKGFAAAMIEKQVVLVDPQTKQIAVVITQEAR